MESGETARKQSHYGNCDRVWSTTHELHFLFDGRDLLSQYHSEPPRWVDDPPSVCHVSMSQPVTKRKKLFRQHRARFRQLASSTFRWLYEELFVATSTISKQDFCRERCCRSRTLTYAQLNYTTTPSGQINILLLSRFNAVISFVFSLLNDTLKCTGHITLNGRMSDTDELGKDVGKRGLDLRQSIIQVFFWRDWGKRSFGTWRLISIETEAFTSHFFKIYP